MAPAVTPRIGLSIAREPASWGAWRGTADLSPAAYSDQIRVAGGLPLLLPAGALDVDREAELCVAAIDGLVLSGGADVDPARYGAERHVSTDVARIDRDEWELALTRAALAADLPLLAVCRGLQVLNVELGGNLIQHLPDAVGHEDHRSELGRYGQHRVRFDHDTVLATIYGAETNVPTHHHQAVDTLGRGLVATAWASDGTVEAVTCPGRAWVHGVQWHPEVADGQGLFTEFVRAAAAAAHVRTVAR